MSKPCPMKPMMSKMDLTQLQHNQLATIQGVTKSLGMQSDLVLDKPCPLNPMMCKMSANSRSSACSCTRGSMKAVPELRLVLHLPLSFVLLAAQLHQSPADDETSQSDQITSWCTMMCISVETQTRQAQRAQRGIVRSNQLSPTKSVFGKSTAPETNMKI